MVSHNYSFVIVLDKYFLQHSLKNTFLIVFGAHMKILSIIKVNSLVLIQWSYRSTPPIMLTIKHEMVIMFEHATQFHPTHVILVPVFGSDTKPHTTQM